MNECVTVLPLGAANHADDGEMMYPSENIPALPASDWSAVRIYLRFLHLIGPSSPLAQLPKVNALHAARQLAKDGDAGAGALEDTRFAKMFNEEAFAIDEESKDYQVLHPNAVQVSRLLTRARHGHCRIDREALVKPPSHTLESI